MDALKVTFVNGEELSFAISPESTLSIETPDGVNGVQRGVVSEVVNVEYVKAVADAPAEVAQPDPTPTAAPDVAASVDAPAAPADEVTPAAEVTPDPPIAASSDTSATSSSTDSTSSDTTDEAATSQPVTDETPDQGDTAA